MLKDHLINLEKIRVEEIMLTSIDNDDTMDGYDIETLKFMSELINVLSIV